MPCQVRLCPAPDLRKTQLQAVPSPQTAHCSSRKEPQHVLISYMGQEIIIFKSHKKAGASGKQLPAGVPIN